MIFNIYLMEKPDYVEWVPAGRIIRGAIFAETILILVIVTLLVVFVRPLDYEAIIGIGISLFVMVFVLLLFVNFRGIKIHISPKKLNVSYGLLNNKTIKLDDINSCRTVKASFGRYGGVGVRFGFDRSTAYTTSLGNAVEVNPKKGRVFVFSSNNPDKICELISKK